MGYEQLDRLTREEVQSIKRRTKAGVRPQRRAPRAGPVRAGAHGQPVIFAEGDSWFDFPPGVDVIDHLVQGHDLAITRFSRHGDTLDNMVYGVKSGTPQIEGFLAQAQRDQPRVVLFSGGGNDVMGGELLRYLNHSLSGLPPLREGVADYLIHTALRSAVRTFITRVRGVAPDAHFILHGYARPFPTGMKTHCGPIAVAGPWIKPSLAAMKVPLDAGTALVHGLADMFNGMLGALAASMNSEAGEDYVSHLDLRPLIGESDWRDELHLRSSAFARVADRFAQEVSRVTGHGPAGAARVGAARADADNVHPYWQDARQRTKKPVRRRKPVKKTAKRKSTRNRRAPSPR